MQVDESRRGKERKGKTASARMDNRMDNPKVHKDSKKKGKRYKRVKEKMHRCK